MSFKKRRLMWMAWASIPSQCRELLSKNALTNVIFARSITAKVSGSRGRLDVFEQNRTANAPHENPAAPSVCDSARGKCHECDHESLRGSRRNHEQDDDQRVETFFHCRGYSV